MMRDPQLRLHFTDYFNIHPSLLENHGAFNISLLGDLPLFIDPFLLFNSQKREYQQLHDQIIKYLKFLRGKSTSGILTPDLVSAWYKFPEVKQTWLGFSFLSNQGRGLGSDFATSLDRNLGKLFSDFGKEKVTKGSHLEKLALVRDGVGKDGISDFTTVLIKDYLLSYTQAFAQSHIEPSLRKKVPVSRTRFNYSTESWVTEYFDLPWHKEDYVLLTPKDILTRDDVWINRNDLIDDFSSIVEGLPNEQLRAQLNNYLKKLLPPDPTSQEERRAIGQVILRYPQVIEHYIRHKEDNGDRAVSISEQKVLVSQQVFVNQAKELGRSLFLASPFYQVPGDTYTEAKQRAEYLKDVIENKGGWRIFYSNGETIRTEEDLQIMYRLTWMATLSDISREVDDGRGPADFKASRGAFDKSIIEFKLALNRKLKMNLEHQAEVYMKASDADKSLKVITYFTEAEYDRVIDILRDLGLMGSPDIILIDARSDNKPSGSVADCH